MEYKKISIYIKTLYMDLFKILFIVLVSIFTSYVSFIWIKYGIQRSISDSYYKLDKNWNVLFTLFCWGFSLPAMIIGLQLTGSVLMFFGCSGIMFVGACPTFKDDKLDKWVHMIAAYSGVAFSQLSIIFDFHIYYILPIFLVLAVLLQIFRKKVNNNQIWWQEILAFISICYVYYITLF